MEKKPKLVYIIHGIAVGGAELAALSAFPELNERFRLRVYVLGRSNRVLLDGLEPDVRKNITCFNYPFLLFPLYLPWVCWSLWRFRPDIVIASLWRSVIPTFVYRLLAKGKCFFLLVHSTFFHHALDRVFTKWGIRMADVVFADSTSTQQFVEEIAGPGKDIKTVSFLTVPTSEHVEARQFSGQFRFFTLSRLNPVKRVPLAVRVISSLRDAGLDASLHIYGRPDGDGEAVVNEINRLELHDSVFICGELSPNEKGEIYSHYNCYIQMSAYEGMAMSVVEAMQQRMLCVVTPVGEMPHYATDQVSAVFMDVVDGQITRESLDKLVHVLDDSEKCQLISTNAHQAFVDKPIFGKSLIQAIQNSQSNA